MKKVLRIAGITVGVLLLLLIATPILFKSKIEALVKEKVNEEIEAQVDWSRFSLTFFRGFPDLSVNLHGLEVVGEGAFGGDTLMSLKRFEFRVNPFSALGKEIKVKSILLDRPLVNGKVLEDSTANWDILPAGSEDNLEEADDQKGGGAIAVSLKRFAIIGGRIYYSDEPMDLESAIENVDLELKGDFSMDQTDLELTMVFQGIDAKMGGIRYLNNGELEIGLIATADLVHNTYTLQQNVIRLNGLIMGADGTVTLLEDGGMDTDLRFATQETSFRTLLSMVPAVYLQDFETLETSGDLKLEGSVKGIMKDSILPDAQLTLQVTDGYFSYPFLPKDVSDVQIGLNVDFRGSDRDASVVQLDRFHLLLGGNPFDLKLLVDHPFSDMHVAGEAVGSIDFSSLRDVVPLEDVALTGSLQTDLRWDTRISYIEQEQYERVNLEGALMIEGVNLETPDLPVPVGIQTLAMHFNPRYVELADLEISLGLSDLRVQGDLANFIPYLFDGQTVSGSLAVSSQQLDLNELMPETADSERDTTNAGIEMSGPEEETMAVEPAPPDSLAAPVHVKIPENIEFTMDLDLGKLSYDKIELENVKGEMLVSGGVAYLDQLSMDVIKGQITADGAVDTRGEFTEVDLQLDMKEVDIPSAYETFVTVERLAPMARYAMGTANVEMQYHSLLGATFEPLYGTINAKGRVFTKGLQIYNLKSFVRLSELLKNEKFREMAPDEVNIALTVREGRVIVDPFDVDMGQSKITVSGSHGIDLTMDYLLDMEIAKSDLGEGAAEMMQGLTALAAGAGFRLPESDYIKVKATIQGTFNDPQITTDLRDNLVSTGEQVREAVQERVTEEVEKVEEEVREEVSQRAEEMIQQAEEEGQRLIEEARQAGDALVKEAEAQGEKLVDEAGNNPIRQVAARRAAEELKKQAERQSENLVREAEGRAAELLEKARSEAEKI